MLIDYGTLASATVTYSLNVANYYAGAGFTYHITTKGLLDPDDYEDVVGSFNKAGFSGWNLLLGTEIGLSLEKIGFIYY